MKLINKFLRPLIQYRGFILGTVKREFQLKYQGSLLGVAWIVLQPLTMIFVYTVIFSQIMRAKLPGVDSAFSYSIYICSGILTWSLFTEIVSRSNTVFIDNGNLIKKANFPRICLPAVVVLTALLNFAIVLTLFLLFLLITHNFPGHLLLGMFPILILEVLFAIGLGIFLGTINVFFRDAGQITTILLQLWFWCTPIVYPISIIPERVKHIVSLNPMVSVMASYQQIFVNRQWPQWDQLSTILIATIVMLSLGFWLFIKRSPEMVDEL